MRQEDHRTIREQLGAFALDQLDVTERVAVQAHLDGCPSCRGELAAIAPLAGPLRTVRPDRIDAAAVPPPYLGEAVFSRIRAEAAARPIPMVRPHPPVLPGIRTAGQGPGTVLRLAAAAAVIALAAGAIGFGLSAQGQGASQAVLESVAVQAAAADVRASAELVPHTWGLEIKLVATGFEPGLAYRVSVTDDQGRTADAGGFVGTGANQMRCNLNSSVLRADAAAFEVRGPDGAVVLSAGL